MRSDEMSVVTFSGGHGLMTEKFLDRANIDTSREKLYCERVAETMRVGVDTGDTTEAAHNTPDGVLADLQRATPVPEKVRGVEGWKVTKGLHHVVMQQDLKRH